MLAFILPAASLMKLLLIVVSDAGSMVKTAVVLLEVMASEPGDTATGAMEYKKPLPVVCIGTVG